ncbi:MAG: site-2 protease family protein [Myxococcales bacterium]|nr:site-2 protease family protein [Myxococcales bacterium]
MSPAPRARSERGGWSWTIGSLFGVRIRIHATFTLLLAWIVASNTMSGEGTAATIRAVVMTLSLFAIVVMHEFGHVLAARRYGIVTRDIMLLPIGGVASMERLPDDPRQEFVVAIAGPAVNVALALGFAALAFALDRPLAAAGVLEHADWVGQLFWANVVLAVFNLIPAFPMDGGRVLRALLALRMGTDRATATAARLGQGLALLFGFLGLFSNPMLVFVALFVWTGAAGEASAVHLRASLAGLRARDVMATSVIVVDADDTLASAVELVAHGFQSEFPVVANDGLGRRVVGWLGLRELIAGLSSDGHGQRIAAVMREGATSVGPDDALTGVLEQMQRTEGRAAAVVDRGEVVGLLTLEHLGEFVAIEDAIGMRARLGAAP